MNIRDLKYLVAIADYNHFGMAAEACFVSQPALSMQIKKLENTLGVKLIERTTKYVLLTEIGKLITEKSREILANIESIKEMAKQSKDPFSGEFHLGVVPTLAPYLLPHIIPCLTKVFPKLSLYLVEDQTSNLLEKLKQGKLDGALLGIPHPNEEFFTIPLFEEEFMLALPANHALSKRKKIGIKDLENKTLLLLEDGHCMRDLALEVCDKAHAKERKGFRATSLETLRHMVASNAGITLIPKLAYKPNDGIHYVPFNTPKPIRTISMVGRLSGVKKTLLESISLQIRKSLAKYEAVNVIYS